MKFGGVLWKSPIPIRLLGIKYNRSYGRYQGLVLLCVHADQSLADGILDEFGMVIYTQLIHYFGIIRFWLPVFGFGLFRREKGQEAYIRFAIIYLKRSGGLGDE